MSSSKPAPAVPAFFQAYTASLLPEILKLANENPAEFLKVLHTCFLKGIEFQKEQPTEPVTVVVEMNGGVINNISANQPVRVIVLDEDTESGGEEISFGNINGSDVYIQDHAIEGSPSEILSVNETAANVDQHWKNQSEKDLLQVVQDR
jgi:hypothetical protein